jgi:hypothetical protein
MTEKSLQPAPKQAELAKLGDGEVFIRRTPAGVLRSVRGVVILSEDRGHIAGIGDNRLMYTQEAYEEANKIASISIITPPKLTLNTGEIVVNPYPILDRDSGTIAKVWVKKMAIGYSPIGNLVITSATLLYDTLAYFIQDLAKKIEKHKGSGKVCMKSMLTDDELKNGVFHALQGELGVWADYNHPEILKALGTFIQKKLFAERLAQTICERLVYSKHPALVLGKPTAKVMKVPIIGFCHEHSQDELIELANKAAEANPGDTGEPAEVSAGNVKAQTIDVSSEVTHEDVETTEVEDVPTGAAGQVGIY